VRLGGKLGADEIAAMDSEELVAIFCAKARAPPLPGEHGPPCTRPVCRRGQGVRRQRREDLEGREVRGGSVRRLRALPGYGDEKSKIFVAISRSG
jgi:hypothetical protein